MNAVIIGSSGHYEYALAGKLPVLFSAVAPGFSEEPTEKLIADVTAHGGKPEVFSDPLEMLDALRPDIAVINTRPDKNSGFACEAMKRGISVFCEKPAAINTEALDDVILEYKTANESRGKGKSVCYAAMFGITYEPCFETVRRIVTGGQLGEIRLASAQKSYKLGVREPYYSLRQQLGGMIPWVAIHGIDWLYSVCGLRFSEVFSAQSRKFNGGNGELEATAICGYVCENGALATVTADYLRPGAAKTHGDDRLRIVGTDGIAEVRAGRAYLIDGNGERELELTSPENGLFDEFLIEAGGGKKCRAGLENAYYVTRAALLTRLAADENGIVKF